MKKMILLSYTIFAALFVSQICQAQFKLQPSVVFGFQKSSITGESESWKDPFGIQGGIILPMPEINESMCIRVELNGSMQGAKWVEGELNGRVNLLYINAPVVLRYQTTGGFFGEAGIQPGVLLSAKDKYNGGSYDYKDEVNTLDFGIPFGIGYEFDYNFSLGLRVIQGLSNINKDSDAKDHNFVVVLRGTYAFKK
jgi:hypothetical protein